MKKISVVSLCCIVILLSACSIQGKVPTEGIWYCEELKMSIDFFSLENNNNCVKYYLPDGTYQVCKILRDYGRGVTICSTDQETDYLNGIFRYRDDVFKITTHYDEITYLFYRID